MGQVVGGVAAGLVVMLLQRLFSWLPASLGLCVWAVIATFFFIIVLKLVGVILDFILGFINMLKP